MPELPLFIEAAELHDNLQDNDLFLIDISIPQVYQAGHVPGAIHLPYPRIVYAHDNVDCDIPGDEMLSKVFSEIGLEPHHHVVTYDSQYNPMASRLCWTLEEIGHRRYSILNGGSQAWKAQSLPLETEARRRASSSYQAHPSGSRNATLEYIKSRLNDPNVVIVDTRMYEEFTNELVMTDRGGKIPGAIHLDWMISINEDDHFRLHSDDTIRDDLERLGITPDREIIVYCQTHMRSAHTYQVLRHLGYPNVRGYAAGYAEWGNDEESPIEDECTEVA